jgi:putative peptide zinc metalloprotease protein
MLCRSCRRQVSRKDALCSVCGAPVARHRPGQRAGLELVLADGRRIPLLASLTIGRGEGNLIRLNEDSISRHHARIVVEDGVPALEDAGSTYGTFVDGKKLTGRQALRDGNLIKLGDLELRIEGRRGDSASGKTVMFGAVGASLDSGSLMRPTLRAGTRLKRLEANEGDLRFVLSGPDGRFVRMSAAEAELLELLNGETTLADLLTAAAGRGGPEGPGRLASLLADLGERGLLEGIDETKPTTKPNRAARIFRTRQWNVTWAGPVFERVYRAGGFVLFTAPVLLVIAVVCVVGVGCFGYMIAERQATPFVVGSRVGVGALIFLVGRFLVVIVHEFAHGLTVASFGRKVPKAGIKLMLVFPYAFVDTSEAYFEPSRRRIAISAAGPVSDLSIGGGAALAALVSPAGTLRDVFFQLALAAYTGAIFNLNPLLDRDGYHIIVDLLREPGLRKRAREWMVQRLSGRPGDIDEAGVLATYSVTALVWSLATAGFTIVMSQRYYGYLTALAPAGVVWTVLIAFYFLMLVPILGVFWKGYAARRSDRRARAELPQVDRAVG